MVQEWLIQTCHGWYLVTLTYRTWIIIYHLRGAEIICVTNFSTSLMIIHFIYSDGAYTYTNSCDPRSRVIKFKWIIWRCTRNCFMSKLRSLNNTVSFSLRRGQSLKYQQFYESYRFFDINHAAEVLLHVSWPDLFTSTKNIDEMVSIFISVINQVIPIVYRRRKGKPNKLDYQKI